MNLPLLICLLAAAAPESSAASVVQWAEPWQSEYAGEDAAGKHVLALWKFTAGAENADASGRGHPLRLNGAQTNPHGRFGACLESFCGWPKADQRHSATTKNQLELSPKGPFTLELWISPQPELADYGESFLLDKKYVAHDDYQLILGPADRGGSRVLRACLGFGADSATWFAEPFRFEAGAWYHLAFSYDAAGTGSFFINGTPCGSKRIDGRKQISPGKHDLSIGDRIGSLYHGFPGLIDEVRISEGAREFRPVRLTVISDRTCFVRMEPDAVLRLALTNLQRSPLAGAEATISLEGIAPAQTKLSHVAPGASVVIDYPLDTALRPDTYRVLAEVKVHGSNTFVARESLTIRLVPRQPPDRFPVLMWGIYGHVNEEAARLKQIGFSHVLGVRADYAKIWEAGKPTEAEQPQAAARTKQMLDEALANDLTVMASLSPGSFLRGKERFQRVNRNGEQPKAGKKADICGLFPEIRRFCYNVGAAVAQTYGHFPAFRGALIHTEVRDGAAPCFHPQDLQAYREFSGAEVPAKVGGKRGIHYTKLPGFPADRVIPDDHPLYRYYRWYWKTGDGWNGLNTAVHQGLRSTGRPELWTFHDPAVRVASVYGSGGEVDVLSQWTYSYPDPIRIAVATDELMAMAAGSPLEQAGSPLEQAGSPLEQAGSPLEQRVMKMTQVIWYRSQTAPPPAAGGQPLSYQAAWEREQPDAPFITIAPMHLREAFWTKIARPIKGIMYHGWQSLVPCEGTASYRHTHPQTQHELARLIEQVIRPLGPTLLHVPGAPADVAFLESFAAEMFAQRGTFGWGGSWLGDAYHVMLYGHLQPEIVFDETITQRGLDGFRVLVMPDCDVITQGVYERIKEFQARGGIVVGDERTAPAVRPDIVLQSYTRTGRAAEDKAALLARAAELRSKLDARYLRYVDSSNAEVIPYRRRHGQSDYVFVVNDRREFGQYVGQHGLVMENGLPSEATLTVRRPKGYVYDLVAGRAVPARKENDKLAIDVQLGPCDGRLYMISPQEIDRVRITAPAEVARGSHAQCVVEVLDAAGQRLEGVVPLEVQIRDPEGRRAEFSGFYAAVDGRVEIGVDIAANDLPGAWQLDARELASGRSAVGFFRVPGPKDWPPARKAPSPELANPVQPKG